MSKEGCGFGCLAIIGLFVLLGSMASIVDGCENRAEQIEEQRDANEREAAAAQMDAEERTLAIKIAPDLQNAIDRLDREIGRKRIALDELKDRLILRERDPERNDIYRRWRSELNRMQDAYVKLSEQRTDLYLAHSAAVAAGGDSDEVDNMIESALEEAADVQADLEDIETIDDADQIELDDLDVDAPSNSRT